MFDSESLADLYQELILDHSKNPRCSGCLENPTSTAKGFNPLCGDKIDLYLHIDDNVITDISFDASGCAISVASASLMSELLKGKRVEEARDLFEQFHNLLTTGNGQELTQDYEELGELVALSGVRQFPIRIKCATLAWHALKDGLNENESVETTT